MKGRSDHVYPLKFSLLLDLDVNNISQFETRHLYVGDQFLCRRPRAQDSHALLGRGNELHDAYLAAAAFKFGIHS